MHLIHVSEGKYLHICSNTTCKACTSSVKILLSSPGRDDLSVPVPDCRPRRLLRRHHPRHLRVRPAGLGILRQPVEERGV